MLERLLDRNHDDRRGLLALDSKPPFEAGINANPGSAVDPIGLVRAGNQKDEPDARVFHQVLEAVDPIIATAVRDQQRATVVLDMDKARLVTLGRAVEPLAASRRQNKKWRGSYESTPCRIDMVDLFPEDALRRSCMERRQLIDGGHGGISECFHSLLPFESRGSLY